MEPLSSTTLHGMLQHLARLAQRPELVHRFASMKPLPKDKGTDDLTISIPWRLDLSMRSQESHDLYRIVNQLCGNGMTQLVLMTPPDQLTTKPSSSCHQPEASEMIKHLAHLQLSNPANLCYILSVLRSQLWASLMQDDFDAKSWGPWAPGLTSLLSHVGEQPVHLHSQAVMGTLLEPWFDGHTFTQQQDAAEFASWLRQQLFVDRPVCIPLLGWQKCLLTTIEDQGLLQIPLVLRSIQPQKCRLQSLVDEWFDQQLFTCALVQPHSQLCLQVDRYPALGIRFCEPVLWDRTEVLLPVFDHHTGLEAS